MVNSDELVLEYAPRGKGKKTSKGIKKEDAFQRDQQSTARKLACALRFPVSVPTTDEISSLTKAASSIIRSNKREQACRALFVGWLICWL